MKFLAHNSGNCIEFMHFPAQCLVLLFILSVCVNDFSLAIGLIGVDSFAFLVQASLVKVMNDTFQNTLTQAV